MSDEHHLDWLSGGGEMGALIRSMDWSSTPLGPFEAWPQSLRTTVSLCLSSTFPILIAWGPERVQIYNDSYRPIAGELHPTSMGQRFNECWASALPAVGHVVDRAQQGTGSYIENLRMFLDRYGYLEEAFMTFSFSPIRDESGQVGGLFHPITEVTDKMLGERRTLTLRDLSARIAKAKTVDEAWQLTEHTLAEASLDLPFLLFYQLSDEAREATLRGAVGLAADSSAAPGAIALDADAPEAESSAHTWPVARAVAAGEPLRLDDLRDRFQLASAGPYPEPPRTALLLPIQPAGAPAPLGCLIAGVSPRRVLDAGYQAFFDSLATIFTTALGNVRAYEQEQRRADELAALDRAKTAFFSNVSHEFRTPLTLILGPTEDALDSPEQALSGADLATVHRNELRLLKLVNSLLDFSRIEAGRVQASYEPSDLGSYTADLASAFRSTIERAGLHLSVQCEPLAEPVWVDHEMWEKIVLNLISNAFKFTFEGEIEVALSRIGEQVELRVRDTGTGIAESELPRLFERFHRVEGARGRSYEGSGIGLALVQELVRLHGGTLTVSSELGKGTTFRVAIPTGSAHLPSDRLQGARTLGSTATRADAFVREAEAWSDATPPSGAPAPRTRGSDPGDKPLASATPSDEPVSGRVLIADDNADMRAYLTRLLQVAFTVEAVSDGRAALESARAQPPDLVLSDVMMPQLDGFGLLRELKADARLSNVPVILLSARAGDEAKIEGIRAGASDYLVKPFSARELLARVEGSIRLAKVLVALERQNEFEQQLVGIVSHDLRNPLNAIQLGANVLLRREHPDERTIKAIERIARSAEGATRLVRDLLDFTQARLGSGIPIRPEPLDLATLLHTSTNDLRASYPERTFQVNTSGDTQGTWDADRLAQVIANLGSNAAKYSPPGAVVSLSVIGETDCVTLSVHNPGPAIAGETLARLFEPMQRGAGTKTDSDRSIGLGLFIVRQIVIAHGGTIRVDSDAERGTELVLRLPR